MVRAFMRWQWTGSVDRACAWRRNGESMRTTHSTLTKAPQPSGRIGGQHSRRLWKHPTASSYNTCAATSPGQLFPTSGCNSTPPRRWSEAQDPGVRWHNAPGDEPSGVQAEAYRMAGLRHRVPLVLRLRWVVHCRPRMSAIRWLNLGVSFPAVSSRGRPALADPLLTFEQTVRLTALLGVGRHGGGRTNAPAATKGRPHRPAKPE